MIFIALICLISFMGKNLTQYFLDTYAITKDGKPADTFFRARIFLPYSYNVPAKFNLTKRICNIFYYIFLATVLLSLVVSTFNR